jgi:hypothetical protein
LTEKTNGTAWYRLKKQLKELSFEDRETELGKIIKEVDKFEVVRLEEHKNKL